LSASGPSFWLLVIRALHVRLTCSTSSTTNRIYTTQSQINNGCRWSAPLWFAAYSISHANSNAVGQVICFAFDGFALMNTLCAVDTGAHKHVHWNPFGRFLPLFLHRALYSSGIVAFLRLILLLIVFWYTQ